MLLMLLRLMLLRLFTQLIIEIVVRYEYMSLLLYWSAGEWSLLLLQALVFVILREGVTMGVTMGVIVVRGE
ncbi:hypothetical protein SAMD00019534_062950 [Acytostelium subglobosum LB1]|uniref:hypothetical protein n=1 Tax=Acytostelium subglobosum LB1 TaxID=1410327 RepID=UPI0006448773|nr:hypothetical protein SAMD00019534_062950 [Acytostelium subglobosum LB1]GAM23120.1 hypothetical protein SAMD00019534_062950 [Acytostelium subglobosum LB1]|eukprot:XP_012754347.1 hypothetical protein SAMD00019534_062950 [Acytostelium subglobosum LB1]